MKKKKSALLVIDVINSCSNEECEIKKWGISFRKIRKMVPKLQRFIVKYRKKNIGPVIYVKTVPWRKKYLTKNINKLYENPKKVYYSKDKSGFAEEFYLIKSEKGDLVVEKNTYSAFATAKLNNFLKKNKVDTLLVAGIFGDGCVDSTIQHGFAKGYNFIIFKDLIETTDVPIRQKIQSLLKERTWPSMFGDVINSKDL
jgi:nicotinamidase-related amidase